MRFISGYLLTLFLGMSACADTETELKWKPAGRFENTPEKSAFPLIPPDGELWDLAKHRYLLLDLENRGNITQDFWITLKSGAEHSLRHSHQGRIVYGCLRAGERKTFQIRIPHQGAPGFDPLLNVNGFLPDGVFAAQRVDESRIERMLLCGNGKWQVHSLRLVGEYRPNPAYLSADRFFPLADRYGQNRHEQWPGKIKSDDDLKTMREKEQGLFRPRPRSWNRWGGWEDGPTLEATGFFRTEKYRGKWYIVDPDGKLFFSSGINAINIGSFSHAVGREALFEDRSAIRDGKVAFLLDNIRRKFGEGRENAYYDFVLRRLDSWGVNTLGNWSAGDLCRRRKIPYTAELRFPGGEFTCIGGIRRHRDPFSEDFRKACEDLFADKELDYVVGESGSFSYMKNDPWCIGIYISNEWNFGRIPDDILKSGPDLPSKRELAKFLRERYRGSVEALNRAWGSNYSDWDAFLRSTEIPRKTPKAREDLDAFMEHFVSQYFRLCRNAIKRYSPNTMYLGSRFIWSDPTRPWLNRAAANYMDIVSYNLYGLSYDGLKIEGLGDKPVMITETTIGSDEPRGYFGALSEPAKNPGERNAILERKMETLFRHPLVVGVHHFCYASQPLTNRGQDEENFNFGFVDQTDTPYWDFVEAYRNIIDRMYEFRSNSK